jgi:hypothetical protein
MARLRRPGAEIKDVILAEAAHLDLAPATALAIGSGILSGGRRAG